MLCVNGSDVIQHPCWRFWTAADSRDGRVSQQWRTTICVSYSICTISLFIAYVLNIAYVTSTTFSFAPNDRSALSTSRTLQPIQVLKCHQQSAHITVLSMFLHAIINIQDLGFIMRLMQTVSNTVRSRSNLTRRSGRKRSFSCKVKMFESLRMRESAFSMHVFVLFYILHRVAQILLDTHEYKPKLLNGFWWSGDPSVYTPPFRRFWTLSSFAYSVRIV